MTIKKTVEEQIEIYRRETHRWKEAIAKCEKERDQARDLLAALEKQANAAMDKIMTLDAELRQWRRMKTDPGCTHMNLMTGAIALTRKQALHFAGVEEQMKKDCAP